MQKVLSYEEWKKIFDEEYEPSLAKYPDEDTLRKMYWREEGQFRTMKKGVGSH